MAGRLKWWRLGVSWTRALVGALMLSSCASDVEVPGEPVYAPPTLVLASPQVIRVTDGLRVVPDTLVLELRDVSGEPRRGEKIYTTGTTGWLRQLPSRQWYRPHTMVTDSLGRLVLLWLPSADGAQKLSFTAMGPAGLERSFSLARPGVPFRADSVVSSGRDAICFQRGGRIGCLGTGTCNDCGPGVAPSVALESVHWFRLTSPPVSLTTTLSGACALLSDGNTTCWDGLGPDSVARNDVGHPPFVEFTGSIGRTADGTVWKGVISGPSGYAHGFGYRTWNRIPSDSVIVSLLADFDESFLCARTASDAVMCSVAERGLLEPSVIMQPFRLLRSAVDSSAVHAVSGYTAVYYEYWLPYPSVVVRAADGTSLKFGNPSHSSDGWYGTPVVDTTLSGTDVRTRACVAELEATCAAGEPWRNVSIAGRMTARGPNENGQSGFLRTCAVRDVIVCHLLIKTAAGRGWFASRYESLDTVKLAP